MRTILYFLTIPGCGACKQAKPAVAAVQKAMPHIEYVEGNIVEMQFPKHSRWVPQGSPAYAVVREGRNVEVVEGLLTEAELRNWLLGAPPSGAQIV